MISDELSPAALAREWNGPSYWSPAIGLWGGVAILCSPYQRGNISVWQKEPGGRLVSLLLSINGICINLVNIYSPMNPTERKTFFQSLDHFLFPNSRLIKAGDFNCYDSALDKMGGSAKTDACLSDLKSIHALRDAWHLKHPRDRQFTWFNSDLSIASRLDSFIISGFMCEQVVTCEIHPCVFSDHDFVHLELNLHSTKPRGPGVWKFNNSLLQDDFFCCFMFDVIDRFLQTRSSFRSDIVMWDNLKKEMKSFCINYSREKWCHFSRDKILTINRLSFLKRQLASGNPAVKSEIFLETTI